MAQVRGGTGAGCPNVPGPRLADVDAYEVDEALAAGSLGAAAGPRRRRRHHRDGYGKVD